MNKKSVHILLIEDNAVHVTLIENAFHELGDVEYSFTVLDNGHRAKQYFSTLVDNLNAPHPDLIFLDLDLPKMNGFDVLNYIKSTHYLKHIPVLIISGSIEYDDIMKCYQNYCSSFIVKPTNKVGFRKMVKSIEKFWFGITQLPIVNNDRKQSEE